MRSSILHIPYSEIKAHYMRDTNDRHAYSAARTSITDRIELGTGYMNFSLEPDFWQPGITRLNVPEKIGGGVEADVIGYLSERLGRKITGEHEPQREGLLA